MNNKKTIKNILIALLIAIALLVAYSVFSQKEKSLDPKQVGLSSVLGDSGMGQIEETDATLVNADILKILGSIENIELKDDIFSNPVFRKLKDTHFAIPRPARVGRPNPFLPIGFDLIANINENTGVGNMDDNSTNEEQNTYNPFANVDNSEGEGNFFDGSVVDNLNSN